MKSGFTFAAALLAGSIMDVSNAVKLARREYEVPVSQDIEGDRALLLSDPNAVVNKEHRVQVRYTLSFDECPGIPVKDCEDTITKMFEEDPTLFRDVDNIYFKEDRLPQPGDPNYNYVGMMTNPAGTHVVGWNGDGVVHYKNPNFDRENIWCTSEEPCPDEPNHVRHLPDKCCFHIGPWDCDTGVPKSPEDCCKIIKSSVPPIDFLGNELICHTAHPVGSIYNPIDYSRIQVLFDAEGKVVGEPTNE